jgi:hypothetical protein
MRFANFFHEHFIKTPIDYRTWDRQLLDKGWERKGEGSFGVAYVHPLKGYIYKIFRKDKGYDFFLDFALQNQDDPCVVKLKRIILRHPVDDTEGDVYLSGGYVPNVVAIEKLVTVYDTPGKVSIFNIAGSLIYKLDNVYKDGMSFEEAIDGMTKYCEQQYSSDPKYYRELLRVLRSSFIYKARIFRTMFRLYLFKRQNPNSVYWDLHEGNFMIRRSTGEVVLTDPFV